MDGPTVGAMSTAWLSSPEVDNERDGPTVGAMSTASLSSPEVDNERDGQLLERCQPHRGLLQR